MDTVDKLPDFSGIADSHEPEEREYEQSPEERRSVGVLWTMAKEAGFNLSGKNTPGFAAEKNGKYAYLRPLENGNYTLFASDQMPEDGAEKTRQELEEYASVEVLEGLVT